MTYELEYDGRLLTATDEQTEIIDRALSGTENIMISALAGAAKTSTLQFLCKYLPPEPTLSIAFNKRIAEEMQKRLPDNVVARTMNSVGHGAWQARASKRLIVDKDKSYNFLKMYIDSMPKASRLDVVDMFAETLAAIRAAKIAGYVPEGLGKTGLIEADDFFASIVDEVDRTVVDGVLVNSIRAAFEGGIDFDDQIYMPVIFGGNWPRYGLVMVDETQDLSNINHAMVEQLVMRRLMAVGDDNQSIYAFRGAVTGSMARLRKKFKMVEMTLSVSFRCPQAVVRMAQKRAPHMKWAPWAAEGSVRTLERWTPKEIPDNAAIVCRNNAPLFALAIKLLKLGRGVKCVGTDLGSSLVRQLKKLGPDDMPQEALLAAIDAWEQHLVDEGKKDPDSISDRADCFRVFARWGKTLGEAAAYADALFKQSGTIQLLSGHKAKGLEWDTVFHLDPWRVPSKYAQTEEDKLQELNIEYVITTRSKSDLILVNLEDFSDGLQQVAPSA